MEEGLSRGRGYGGMIVCLAFLLCYTMVVVVVHPSLALDPTADVYILCNTQHFPNGSDALTALLHTLEKKAASASYSRAFAGTLQAAYQCRGDLSLPTCSQCVQAAVHSALSSCPNAIGSRVQLDGCFLRYENYSFFTEDSSVVIELCNTQHDNSSSFQSKVTKALAHVTAAAPKNKLLYASASSDLGSSASINGTSSTRLYALAQCLDYLSPTECAECLAAHASSWQDCDHAVGAQIHSVSCYYRFEIYPFYYVN